jgi:hypothetical protein
MSLTTGVVGTRSACRTVGRAFSSGRAGRREAVEDELVVIIPHANNFIQRSKILTMFHEAVEEELIGPHATNSSNVPNPYSWIQFNAETRQSVV